MKHTEKRQELSTERTELAKAIEAARDAAAHCEALRTSIARVEDERFAARQKLDAAAAREADESNSRDDVIERLIAGDTGAAVLERAVDRKETTDAERAIETCNAALSLLRGELADVEQTLELRTRRVQDAAGAVIAAERLEEMITDTNRLRGELEAREAVLSFIHPYIPRDQAAKVERSLVSSSAPDAHPAVAPWRTAIESLMADAAGELPR